MRERLEIALNYLAACIEAGDESLLPLFEQIECEIMKIDQKHNALTRARRMAGTKRTQIIPLSSRVRSSCGVPVACRVA